MAKGKWRSVEEEHIWDAETLILVPALPTILLEQLPVGEFPYLYSNHVNFPT